MKVLLLGAGGQLGKSIQSNFSDSIDLIKLSKNKLSISNKKALGAAIKQYHPEIVINAAAYTKVDGAEKNKKTCYKVNALSVKKISEWCQINQCLLIYYSTDYIFNGRNKNPWEESSTPNPINFYGKSKLDGENFIIKSKCDYLILRISWIYSEKGENFPKKIIKKIKENKILNVVNDQIGTPNHASFISEVTIKILKKILKNPELNPKILNVSARGNTSYYKFAKRIKKSLGPKYKDRKFIPISTKDLNKLVKDYSKMKRPLNSRLNINKLEKFLKEKMPNWELIFLKKAKKIIRNYHNN